jgi:hypothetical protein
LAQFHDIRIPRRSAPVWNCGAVPYITAEGEQASTFSTSLRHTTW